jgi:hypothetical protein
MKRLQDRETSPGDTTDNDEDEDEGDLERKITENHNKLIRKFGELWKKSVS